MANNLASIGTLRKNKREIPCVIQSAEETRQIGTCLQLFNGELMITSWLPKKSKHVLLLSSDQDVVPLKTREEEEGGRGDAQPNKVIFN